MAMKMGPDFLALDKELECVRTGMPDNDALWRLPVCFIPPVLRAGWKRQLENGPSKARVGNRKPWRRYARRHAAAELDSLVCEEHDRGRTFKLATCSAEWCWQK